MEPEESRLSDRERLARDAQKDVTLLRNVLHFSLWTLVALIPTMALLLVDMPLVWRVIVVVLCTVCWGLVVGGIFRLTGLLDAGRNPISLNPLHAGKQDDQDKNRR